MRSVALNSPFTVVRHAAFCRTSKLERASLHMNLDLGYLSWCSFNQFGPFHHNAWLFKRFGKIPQHVTSPRFALLFICRHCLEAEDEWVWLTLLAINTFNLAAELSSHCRTIIESPIIGTDILPACTRAQRSTVPTMKWIGPLTVRFWTSTWWVEYLWSRYVSQYVRSWLPHMLLLRHHKIHRFGWLLYHYNLGISE